MAALERRQVGAGRWPDRRSGIVDAVLGPGHLAGRAAAAEPAARDRTGLGPGIGRRGLRRRRGRRPRPYNRAYNELGHLRAGRPLGERQSEALDAFDRILNDPANSVEFTLGPGDVFFADDDHVTLRNRGRFLDAPEVANRRCLVRLWLEGEPRNRTASPPRRRARSWQCGVLSVAQ